MNVKVYSSVARFRRSRNGAWLGNGHDSSGPEEIPEERARARAFYTPLAGTTTIEWPDGHREYFSRNSSLHLTGPGDSRLLPEECRRVGGIWYIESGRVYYSGRGPVECVNVPPFGDLVNQPKV